MIQQSTNSLDETESVSKQPQHQHHISPMNQLQSPNKEEAGKKPSKIDHIKQYIFKTVENMPTPKLMWLISPIAIVIYSTAFNIASEVLYSKFTYNSYGISFFKIAVLFLDVFIFLVEIHLYINLQNFEKNIMDYFINSLCFPSHCYIHR